MQADVDELDINILVNVPTSLNDPKPKVYDLDVGELKAVPIDLNKLSEVVSKEVVKNPNFNKLKTKVNKLDKKILDAAIITHMSQDNTDN